jgi:protein SCO1/2
MMGILENEYQRPEPGSVRWKTGRIFSASPFLVLAFLSFMLTAFLGGCDLDHSRLKVYYPVGIGATAVDTLYQTLPDFELNSLDGERVTKASLKEGLSVIGIFQTNCNENCETIIENFVSLAGNSASAGAAFFLVAAHPQSESTEAIRAFVKDQKQADGIRVLFGDRVSTGRLVKAGLRLSVLEDPVAPGGCYLDNRIVLLDKETRIRGYYTGSSAEEMDRLKHDIKRLKKEYE